MCFEMEKKINIMDLWWEGVPKVREQSGLKG